MSIYAPIIILFVLFFCNVPIAFALIGATLSYFIFINDFMPINSVLQQFVGAAESFPLLAIPFFLMVGSVMNYSGISTSLMRLAEVLTGHLKGGLAQVNILLSMMMGGISGSANADAAMQSKILVPEMVRWGYGRPFSAAVTAASSTVTPIIPPGIDLIIYAILANVSVGRMFVAGYTPAILMGLALMVSVGVIAKKRNYQPSRPKRAGIGEIGSQLKKSIWALMIPFGIILGMRFGVFTPTEAGAISVVFCLIIGVFFYKQLKWKHIPLIFKELVYDTGTVMFLIIGAKLFGYYLTLERIPQHVTDLLINISSNKYIILLIINFVLLFLGMFIEGGAAMILLLPLIIPTVRELGLDMTHLGVVIIVNIMIGGLTPPFGSMMFTVCSIVKVRLNEFIREVIPFILVLITILLFLTLIPQISLFLPNLLYR